MLIINFDTHNYVKKLVSAGVTERQAEVQAETLKTLIDNQLATKHDLKELEVNLKRDMKELELNINLKIESIRKDIEAIKSETFKWLVGLLLGQAALIATLVKFLSK